MFSFRYRFLYFGSCNLKNKTNQLHADWLQDRQREPSVKTLCSPLSVEFWKHCVLSGATQRRALPRSQSERAMNPKFSGQLGTLRSPFHLNFRFPLPILLRAAVNQREPDLFYLLNYNYQKYKNLYQNKKNNHKFSLHSKHKHHYLLSVPMY